MAKHDVVLLLHQEGVAIWKIPDNLSYSIPFQYVALKQTPLFNIPCNVDVFSSFSERHCHLTCHWYDGTNAPVVYDIIGIEENGDMLIHRYEIIFDKNITMASQVKYDPMRIVFEKHGPLTLDYILRHRFCLDTIVCYWDTGSEPGENAIYTSRTRPTTFQLSPRSQANSWGIVQSSTYGEQFVGQTFCPISGRLAYTDKHNTAAAIMVMDFLSVSDSFVGSEYMLNCDIATRGATAGGHKR